MLGSGSSCCDSGGGMPCSRSGAEHRRITNLELLAGAQIHVNAAGETGIEASNRAHDVDPLERIGRILLEKRGVLDGVLVGTGRAEAVAGARVPRRGRIRVVVRDLPFSNHEMM